VIFRTLEEKKIALKIVLVWHKPPPTAKSAVVQAMHLSIRQFILYSCKKIKMYL